MGGMFAKPDGSVGHRGQKRDRDRERGSEGTWRWKNSSWKERRARGNIYLSIWLNAYATLKWLVSLQRVVRKAVFQQHKLIHFVNELCFFYLSKIRTLSLPGRE